MNQFAIISRAPAAAVGAGIAATIRAHAMRADADSPEAWIHFCYTAADEAHAAVMENPQVVIHREGSAMRWLRAIAPEDADAVAARHSEEPASDEDVLSAAHQAALTAFRACMPKLTGRRATQAYIACVAVGVQRGYFTSTESKALLYTAQLALAAHPSRRAPKRRK